MALGFLATKARPDVLTLPLPAELVPGLVGALDHLRGSAAAERGAELDALARQLDGAGPLTGRCALLGELLAVAIEEAGDRIAQRGAALLRGEGSAVELRAPLAELGGLLDLHERVEA